MISALDYRLTSLHPRLSDWTGVGRSTPPERPITHGPGTHLIDGQLTSSIKGAGKGVTTLRFTTSLYTLFGKGPWQAGPSDTPGWSSGGGLITGSGAEFSVEDCTLEFPDHAQAPHHYEVGWNAIHFGNVSQGWIRHVRIVNADSGILGYSATNCLFEDIELTWPGVVKNAAGHQAHYGVAFGRGSHRNLVDQLVIKGLCRHDTDVANGASYNVLIRAAFEDYVSSHHGQSKVGELGPHHNLFTDLNVGRGTRVFVDSGGADSAMPHNGPGEVFWNLHKTDGTAISGLPPFTGTRYWRKDLAIIGHTQSRLNTDLTKEWVESLVPVEPPNVFLAQRDGWIPPTPPHGEPPMAKFVIGDRVQATATLVIRGGPSKTSPYLGDQPVGIQGVVGDGPILDAVSGFTYYRINFDAGVDGWCGEDKLTRLDTAPLDPKITARAKLMNPIWTPLTDAEALAVVP